MSGLYKVRNWDNFENNRTRGMKHMMWVPIPNKHDGDGYTELVDHKDGAAHFGAWVAILQLASKCEERGTLMRDNGTPHTPKTMSRQTRLSVKVIEEAIDRLCSSDIGWLEVVDNERVAVTRQEGAGLAHPVDEEENGIEEKEETTTDRHNWSGILKEINDATDLLNQKHGIKISKIKAFTESRKVKYKARLDEGMCFEEVQWELREAGNWLKEWSNFSWDWVFKNSDNWLKISEGKYKDKDLVTKTQSTKPQMSLKGLQ